tara:strand:+ start:502 stop:936 length:435 start_codon:yes stop_codon:yes gene_type:complete
MTRGTFYLILPKTVYESAEFNGDMRPGKDGYGDDVYKELDKVNLLKEFKHMVNNLNEAHYNYDDEKLVYKMPTYGSNNLGFFETSGKLDFRNNYFDRFFSDWVFIKNKSNKIIKVIDKNGSGYLIDKNDTVRFHFGRYYEEKNQ